MNIAHIMRGKQCRRDAEHCKLNAFRFHVFPSRLYTTASCVYVYI